MPPNYPVAQRPHSTITTYLSDELQVTRFQGAVTRSGGRLHLRVRVSVLNHGKSPRERVLRIGRCVAGTPAEPACPATASLRMHLAAGETTSLTRDVTLREPPAKPDEIQAALVSPSSKQPYARSRSGALLVLKGQAWRGVDAGKTFGMHSAPNSLVDRVVFDAAGESTEHLRLFARFDPPSASALAGLRADLTRCVASNCTSTPLAAQHGYSSSDYFGARPNLDRDGADSLGLDVFNTAGARQLSVLLPWPR